MELDDSKINFIFNSILYGHTTNNSVCQLGFMHGFKQAVGLSD